MAARGDKIFFANFALLKYKSPLNIIGLFLHYELDTNRTKNDVISRAVGQTMPSINTEILKDTSVYISESLPEQTAIGGFFRNKSYSNGYPWGAVKRLDKYDMGVLSTLYIVFKVIDVDSEFLVQYYETEN